MIMREEQNYKKKKKKKRKCTIDVHVSGNCFPNSLGRYRIYIGNPYSGEYPISVQHCNMVENSFSEWDKYAVSRLPNTGCLSKGE